MRVTNNMMTANAVWNINKNMERLNKAQEEYTTQSKIQLPSDDPIVATRAVKYRSYVANIEQYQKNVESAISWQKVTEGALDDLGDVVIQLKELVTQASSTGTMTDSDLEDIKSEITELRQTALDIMNTSYAGRYVFGGYATDKEPYSLDETSTEAASVGGRVLFKGEYLSVGGAINASIDDATITSFCTTAYNNSKIYDSAADGEQDIQYNVGFGSSLPVNVEGQDVTGEGLNSLFDTFAKILIGLDGGTSYKTATVDSAGNVTVNPATSYELTDMLDELSKNHETILTAQTALGARMNYANMAQSRLESDYTTYTKLMSENEDADLALSYSDVSTAEYVYEASLSTSAKVMGKSLVDFLT